MVSPSVARRRAVVKVTAMPKAKTLIIDRARWLNGEYVKRFRKLGPKAYPLVPDNGLRDPLTGRMCCLGFYAQRCGVPVKELCSETFPVFLPREYREKMDPAIATHGVLKWPDNPALAKSCADLNDSESIDAKKREERIAKKFAEIGVKVKYVGRYPSLAQLKKEAAKIAAKRKKEGSL